VQPDILEAMVTLTGSAQSSLFLPNSPPLVGVTFFHQMVPIELDGVGCASSDGSNTLVAVTLPWVDAVFSAQTTGLPNSALVIAVTSFVSFAQGAAPLASLLPPHGVPSCDLLVQPDILHLVAAAAGTAQFQAFLPNTPPLVGATFFHQMVPFELDAQGNLVAITSTNALQLIAGDF